MGALGSSGTNSTERGFWYDARFCRATSMMSSSPARISGFSTTNAFTDSPQVSSGTPITAHSSTEAWRAMASSTCTE